MRNMCLLGRVLPNFFSPWNKFENCKQWGTSIVQSTIMTMLDITQYYMALYFYNEYMYGAFDTSLLKHSYCNCGSLWILNCSIKYSYSYSYFCHVFYKGKCCHTISQQNNIGLNASFQEFMHVYTVPMHSCTPYLHLSGKWSC